MRKLFSVAIIFVFGQFLADTVSAAPIVYANRNAFDAANPGTVVETYEGFAAGTTFPNGTGANGIVYTSSTGSANVNNIFLATTNPNSLGRTPISFFAIGDSITFTFDQQLSGFGIDINTFANVNGAFTATTDQGEVISSFFNPFPGFNTGQFLGFDSALPFSSVTITTGPGGQSFNLDTVRAVPVVPEPASIAVWSLLLFAGMTVIYIRRRKLQPVLN